MDKQQYLDIMTTLQSSLTNVEREERIAMILGLDLNDADVRRKLVEDTIGKVTVMINTENGSTTATIDGIEVTSNSLVLAFIGAVVNVMTKLAIDKFLPEKKTVKEGDAGKRDGLGSPAPRSSLKLPREY